MNIDRLQFHKGWFSETCTDLYFNSNEFKKASLIWLDCDLYSSAVDCFILISKIIQDGTVLIIDDWFSNKGSPYHGVQKAFYQWKKQNEISNNWTLTEYQRDSWKRISFIVNRKTT